MDKARLEFGSVPVRVAAKVYGRDPAWVRAGIITGWLPIGEATRNGQRITDIKQMNSKYGRINYGNSFGTQYRLYDGSRSTDRGGIS